jgi:hypothetical protein
LHRRDRKAGLVDDPSPLGKPSIILGRERIPVYDAGRHGQRATSFPNVDVYGFRLRLGRPFHTHRLLFVNRFPNLRVNSPSAEAFG